jgi:hypothetical protein
MNRGENRQNGEEGSIDLEIRTNELRTGRCEARARVNPNPQTPPVADAVPSWFTRSILSGSEQHVNESFAKPSRIGAARDQLPSSATPFVASPNVSPWVALRCASTSSRSAFIPSRTMISRCRRA